MPIEVFTTDEFQLALPSTAIPNGLIDGEYTYSIPLSSFVRIFIRSSIKSNGYSAETGKDSIRLILEIKTPGGQYKPLGKKLQAYITRVSGWQKRLNDGIEELSKRGSSVKSQPALCSICGKSPHVGLSKSPNHLGRPFSKCPDHFDMSFRWLDIEPAIKLELSGVENMYDQGIVEEVEAVEIEEKEVIRGLGLDDPTLKLILSRNGKRMPNDKQAEAITMPLETNIRVLAPAGSGKSTVIEWRIAWMLENKVNPDKIVVTTFSKDMASEALERITKMNSTMNSDYISTINGICNRILVKWDSSLPTYGWLVLQKPWEIKKIIEPLIEQLWLDKSEVPNSDEVYAYICLSKNNSIGLEDCTAFYSKLIGYQRGSLLSNIRAAFDKHNARNKQLTFSDQLYFVERGLKNGQLNRWKNKFDYAIIDEAQDVNFQALRIILQLAKYTFMVGDTDQSLYAFNSARPEVLLSDYAPNIQTVMLDINYRSTHQIISTSSELIKHNYSDLNGPYTQSFMKSVQPRLDAPLGEPVSFTMYNDVDGEGQGITDTILEQLELGYLPGDFFVGSRTRAQLAYIEDKLIKRSIPFINITGGSFWQSRHITNVISYLRLAYNLNDKDAFGKVYNIASINRTNRSGEYVHYRGLGNEFLKAADYSFQNVDEAVSYNKRWYYGVKDLTDFIQGIQAEIKHSDNIGKILQYILDNCYTQWLKSNEAGSGNAEDNIIESLETVISIASEYSKVDEFLSYVDRMIDTAKKASEGNWNDYVILSTYHKLKGLERKIMIGMGWCEGISTKTDEPRGLLPHTFSLVNPPKFGVLPIGGKSEVSEERCIGYVVLSRGKDKCFLTGCAQYRDWKMEPSRFVYEAGLLVSIEEAIEEIGERQ